MCHKGSGSGLNTFSALGWPKNSFEFFHNILWKIHTNLLVNLIAFGLSCYIELLAHPFKKYHLLNKGTHLLLSLQSLLKLKSKLVGCSWRSV